MTLDGYAFKCFFSRPHTSIAVFNLLSIFVNISFFKYDFCDVFCVVVSGYRGYLFMSV